MLVRICGSCGRKVLQGQRCECRKKRDRRDTESIAFYSSATWKRLAKAARARAGYCDEYLLKFAGQLVEGRLVHHIFPIDERPDLKTDLNNLICVSNKTHEMIHAAYNHGGDEKSMMQAMLMTIRK